LRNPEVLLLDEPTSALDPMTEAAVNDTLRRISADRTVITVTHRLQAAVDVDEIFVMEKGRVSEQGSHRELLAARGLYRTLWEKQSGLIVSPDGSSARIELDRLKLIPILKDISDALARELVDRFEPECFPSRSTIIEQGDPGDRFYIIARGTVAVTRSHHGGDRQHVAVLQDGDHFGEIALLEGGPRTSTVSSLQPTVVLTLSRESFHEVLAQDPVLMERITELARSRRDALFDEP
jgi:ATP-binding cassette subfamily B protein